MIVRSIKDQHIKCLTEIVHFELQQWIFFFKSYSYEINYSKSVIQKIPILLFFNILCIEYILHAYYNLEVLLFLKWWEVWSTTTADQKIKPDETILNLLIRNLLLSFVLQQANFNCRHFTPSRYFYCHNFHLKRFPFSYSESIRLHECRKP